MNLNETKRALQLIKSTPECISWLDFGDRGNPCTGRLDKLTNTTEIIQNAISLSNVKQAMPKFSSLHNSISESVATIIGAKWVSYDWLSKILGRILYDDFDNFSHMFNLSILVKAKMKEKGLAQISSRNELFS